MITPGWVRMMARYNAWQSHQHAGAMAGLDDAGLRADRGAFFGSILGTANHLLWGDGMWMSRFDGGDAPGGGIAQSAALCADFAEWSDRGAAMDRRILDWAESVDAETLEGDLRWYSGVMQADVNRPMALCVTHFFNHQTHHRGQIHAMLTQAGADPGATDLFVMPETGPWL